jgi:hypothetical protein
LCALSLANIGPAQAQTIAATEKPAAAASPKASSKSAPKRAAGSGGPHVYLLRGLLNIFSLGMDDLMQKIQAKGIKATVHNHSEWQGLADDIAAKYKAGNHGAVVLIGHSLGADAVMFMGEYLGKKGVPVALIVPFDGTGSFPATSNVQRVMNLTQRDYARMTRGSGFRGELNNIDVTHMGVGHIDIDKSDRLHQMVVAKIQGVLGRGGGTRTAAPGATPVPAPRPNTEPAATPAAAPAAPSKPSGEAPRPAASTTSGSAAAPASAAPAPAASASTAATAPSAASSVTRETPPAPRPASSDAAAKPAIRF